MLYRSLRQLVFVGLLLACVAGVSWTVTAHANYFDSDPGIGERLDAAPQQVVVELTEHLDPGGSGLVVADGSGTRIDNDDAVFEEVGPHVFIAVTLPPEVPNGVYVATWTALSTVDGHVSKGSWSFAVGGGFDPVSVESDPEPWEAGSALARTVSYTGFAAAAGALVFFLYIDPGHVSDRGGTRRSRILATGVSLQLIGALLLLIDTWQKTDLSLGLFVSGTDVGRGLLFRAGTTAVALGVTAWAVAKRRLTTPVVATVVGLLALAAWTVASYGHASAIGSWPIVVDFIHMVAASVWIGGLGVYLGYILALGRRRDARGIAAIGLRFSGVALTSVVLLAATGTINSVVILGPAIMRDPMLLFTDRYGTFLGAKILLTGAMVALAVVNRYVFLGRQPGRDRNLPSFSWERLLPSTRKRMSWFAGTVSTEATLGVAVLLCAGFLTALSPPADITAADGGPEPLVVARDGEDFNVTLLLAPPPLAQAASNLSLRIWSFADGEPLTNATRVLVDVAPVDDATGEAGEGERHRTTHTTDGTWVAGDVLFPQAGMYAIEVTIQTPFVFRDTVVFRVAVGE